MRGMIAPLSTGAVVDKSGRPVWDPKVFAFIEEGSPAPETVNPSLWRQSQLCLKGGLFKVVDRLYQVRNADISNLTIIEGDTGLILVDPLISTEASAAALALYFEHRPRKDVVAVVHSHGHVDHYGGVKGVVDEVDVKAGKVKIIAPVGFLDAAVAENVLAGNVMSRRAFYQYGDALGHRGARRADRGRELLPHPPQHLYPARRPDPRSAGLVALPQRDDGPLGRQVPGDVWDAPLAGLGHGPGDGDAEQGPRCLPLHQRPDPAARQPRLHAE